MESIRCRAVGPMFAAGRRSRVLPPCLLGADPLSAARTAHAALISDVQDSRSSRAPLPVFAGCSREHKAQRGPGRPQPAVSPAQYLRDRRDRAASRLLLVRVGRLLAARRESELVGEPAACVPDRGHRPSTTRRPPVTCERDPIRDKSASGARRYGAGDEIPAKIERSWPNHCVTVLSSPGGDNPVCQLLREAARGPGACLPPPRPSLSFRGTSSGRSRRGIVPKVKTPARPERQAGSRGWPF